MLNNSWMDTLWQRISQWFKPTLSTTLPPSLGEVPPTSPSDPILPNTNSPHSTPNLPSTSTLPSIQPVTLEPVLGTPTLAPVTHTLDTRLLPTLRAEVYVRLGSLTMSTYPLAVGHYHQDTISGAEHVLDQALKGQLSQWQQLGIYAGNIGSSTLVIDRSLKPQGALVVGLGTAGQLQPNELVSTYAQGLLRYTRHPEVLPNTEQIWQLSTLLIGAQAPTLSLEQVLSSLLIGVRMASQRLQEQQLAYRWHIEIIEIDPWRALEASDLLFRLIKQEAYACEFVLAEYLQQLPTSTPVTRPISNNHGWWIRWDLSTTILPRLPSEAERVLPTLDLLPTSARAQWLSGSNIILQVDQSTLGVQWERLQEGSSLALGLQVAVVRQLTNLEDTHEPLTTTKGLLAIGGSSTPIGHELLPNEGMQHWFGLAEAEKIFCALHTGDYAILHWVGSVSGTAKEPYLIMANEQVLSVSDIAQMRQAPRLILLELMNETAELAVLTPQLIYAWFKAGAQMVVINRQSLHTQVSTLWLRRFYQSLAQGMTVGQAVFEARKTVWIAAGQKGNEWLGFECYGEPNRVFDV